MVPWCQSGGKYKGRLAYIVTPFFPSTVHVRRWETDTIRSVIPLPLPHCPRRSSPVAIQVYLARSSQHAIILRVHRRTSLAAYHAHRARHPQQNERPILVLSRSPGIRARPVYPGQEQNKNMLAPKCAGDQSLWARQHIFRA